MGGRFESLENAVSPDAPAGSDLEYDADFALMEKASQGTPDQEYGSTRIEGEPPDWVLVSKTALSLLERTRDLRIGSMLAHAELVTKGLSGFRDALVLMAAWLENLWESVYPQLDADDDNDPTIRINSLMGLSNAGGLLRQLRLTPIVSSRSVGKFSWTECAMAKGELPIPAGMENPPSQKTIDAAVENCPLEQLEEQFTAVADSLNAIKRIESAFSTNLDASSGPDLAPLAKDLYGIHKFQKLWLEQRRPKQSQAAAITAAQQSAASDDAGGLISVDASGRPVPGASAPGTLHAAIYPQLVGAASFVITRREDAIEGLDKIIGWFEQYEPSSPLPMLLKRAKRLSTMSFLEILRDISPGGIEQALVIGGPEPEEEEEEEDEDHSDSGHASSQDGGRSGGGRSNSDDDY